MWCLGTVICGKMIKKSKGRVHTTFRMGVHPGGGRRMNLGRDTEDFSGVGHVLFLDMGGYIFMVDTC